MMITKLLLASSLLLLTSCASSPLSPLVLEGRELHASLVNAKFEDAARLALAPVLRANPYLSSDSAFVHVMAQVASQARLGDGAGIRTALYALYRAETNLGIYGLEAATSGDADRIEGVLRAIWSHNTSLDIVRVHRNGQLFAVVWHDGVSHECWEAANTVVENRLAGR